MGRCFLCFVLVFLHHAATELKTGKAKGLISWVVCACFRLRFLLSTTGEHHISAFGKKVGFGFQGVFSKLVVESII